MLLSITCSTVNFAEQRSCLIYTSLVFWTQAFLVMLIISWLSLSWTKSGGLNSNFHWDSHQWDKQSTHVAESVSSETFIKFFDNRQLISISTDIIISEDIRRDLMIALENQKNIINKFVTEKFIEHASDSNFQLNWRKCKCSLAYIKR